VSWSPPHSWVWDSWQVFDEQAGRHHLFYLHAPTSLGDPELRHRNARLGHASSADLVAWQSHPAPLPSPLDGLDDLATWTGCTVRGDDGWWLFTTGLSRRDDGRVQRIGAARSDDLETWERTPLVLTADHALYQASCATWPEEAWRDPWVVRDHAGTWHMYVTARDHSGIEGSGVVGHATSLDLVTWEAGPALSLPTGRFEWLEVISLVQVDGRWALVFSCLSEQMPGACPRSGGVWSVPVEGPGSRVDVAEAVRLTGEELYAAHVVERAGTSYLMGFRNRDDDDVFLGGVDLPREVRWRADGLGLEVVPGGARSPGPVDPLPQPLV
jgi:beta-fructofuranosidase